MSYPVVMQAIERESVNPGFDETIRTNDLKVIFRDRGRWPDYGTLQTAKNSIYVEERLQQVLLRRNRPRWAEIQRVRRRDPIHDRLDVRFRRSLF